MLLEFLTGRTWPILYEPLWTMGCASSRTERKSVYERLCKYQIGKCGLKCGLIEIDIVLCQCGC